MAKVISAPRRKIASEAVTPTKKTTVTKLRAGDYLSRTSYMRVARPVGTQGMVEVENQDELKWSIDKQVVEQECYSASQYHDEVKVTLTEMVDTFMRAGDAIWTVYFKKKDGTMRLMIGYTIGVEHGLGRSLVVDLEEGENRQVDHRTIEWLILKNVKYTLK